MNDFVVAGLGIATVFVALVCIIFICNIMGVIFSRIAAKPKTESTAKPAVKEQAPAESAAAVSVPEVRYVPAKIENRGAFIAAVSAVIAEDLGCDVSRIRICSVKQRADGIENRGDLCAVVSSVIALDTGADQVRIHSIRKV